MSNRILVLGSSGMAGHVITKYLGQKAEFVVFDCGPRKKLTPKTFLCDIVSDTELAGVLDETRPDVIINCIGVLVKESENDHVSAITVNTLLPHRLSKICENRNIKFIHLSTDCVFSGTAGPYKIDDCKDAFDFYGKTKSLGEIDYGDHLTIRTSIVGPELGHHGTGLLHWFFTQKGTINGYTRALWSGVTTLELARIIEIIVKEKISISGIQQISVTEGISKFDLLSIVNKKFHRGLNIAPVDEPKVDKRLIHSAPENIEPNPYNRQFDDLYLWMQEYKQLYKEYFTSR
ncbi:hypothetical protein B4O97_11880 [Marispirochaeta aestuarii]|uniref:dTDP-4-dehydrorhamnose reductase n=1 Tax=Marispirochaeta aestuarii TaxID=1963862 RepID=A0A1Y1RXV0_9SPIO|nr:SDR family oxidoreductase [Marispirochaeta aestuarii]ORC34640.1 hypothetical protein B4O97_11880 [Marispirochaeta aestuarii]